MVEEVIRSGMINAHDSSDPPKREFRVLVMLQVRMMPKNGSLVLSGMNVGALGWIGTQRQRSQVLLDNCVDQFLQISSVSIKGELADTANIRAGADSVSDWMRVVTGLSAGSARHCTVGSLY